MSEQSQFHKSAHAILKSLKVKNYHIRCDMFEKGLIHNHKQSTISDKNNHPDLKKFSKSFLISSNVFILKI